MSTYRNKYKNFYLDKKGSYVPVGSVVPVLADFYSRNSDIADLDPGLPSRSQIELPHYSYFGFLYCDGSLYNIRDYPGLYEIIENKYLQTTDVANGYSPANTSANGSILRSLFDGDDFYLVFSRDQSLTQNSKDSGQNFVKRPFPFGANIRITNLGNFPSGLLALNTSYQLVAPTTTTITVSANTEFLYKVSGVSGSAVNKPTYTLGWASLTTYPVFTIVKNYNLNDFPYIIGKFRVPDYRQRKLIGYSNSGIAGAGSSTIESRSNADVGATGGAWFISTATIADPSFYVVGDIKTSGYSDISTTVSSALIGNTSFTMGPMRGYRLTRPIVHSHILLNAEPNEGTENATSFNAVDKFAIGYTKFNGSILPFTPGESLASIRPATATGVSEAVLDGSPLEHSHGIIGKRLTSTSVATYGNISGIGEFTVTNGLTNYRSTDTPPIPVQGNLTYDSITKLVSVTTTIAHGLVAGSVVSISGANEAAFNGQYTVSAVGLTGTSFKYIPYNAPLTAPNPAPPAISTGTYILRSANGFFDTRLVTVDPRMWVVDNNTIIGGKSIVVINPGSYQLISPSYEQTAAGTITPPPPAAFFRIEVDLVSSGGGGASSIASGTNAGDNSFIFTLDGTLYTIKTSGGRGGSMTGDGGAAGTVLYQEGSGAFTTTIPPSLAANTKFSQIVTNNGNSGSSGVSTTPAANLSIPGGIIDTFAIPGVVTMGTGGYGTSNLIPNIVTSPAVTITADGDFPLPAGAQTLTVTLVGAGGGDGFRTTNEGNAACDPSILGGPGGSGAKLVAAINVASLGSGSFTARIGKKGNPGGNLTEGSTTDAAGYPPGGVGASTGGIGGVGYWGNGGSGGGGGGSTGLYFASSPILGAGGGGGAGGSGGGWNTLPYGAGQFDVCSTGGPGQQGASFTVTPFSVMDFGPGANGGVSGCSGGAGGGGGAGAGLAGSGALGGGPGGPAGLGHTSDGGNGGAGGFIGKSAYNVNKIIGEPSLSLGNNGNNDGYISYVATVDQSYYGTAGGGGGSGVRFKFSITGVNLQNSLVIGGLTLGNAGGAGSAGAGAGTLGRNKFEYFEQTGGDPNVIGTSVAAGRYYNCNSSGIPSGNAFNSPLFDTSSPDQTDVVAAGNGTGSNGGFTIPTGSGNPSFDGKVTKYIKFAGTGARELKFVALDLSAINRIIFSVRIGDGSNGGADTSQNLDLYYQLSGSTSAVFYDVVTFSTTTLSGWNQYTINISPESSLRSSGTSLILRQQRLSTGSIDGDTYGLSSVTIFYDPQEISEFVTSGSSSLPGNANNTGNATGIDEVRRVVSATNSGITVSDGTFKLSSSTPISTTATATPKTPIPLVTRYHKSKYLIKAF